MKKSIMALTALLIFASSVSAAEDFHEGEGFHEDVVSIEGSSYDIPATVCLPDGDGPFPAVVMLHGTGSTRDEAGDGYKYAAPVLAEKYGIATIRIDFPGNGDSTADYMEYNFHSAVADAKAAASYMAGLSSIDGDAIGVMGWSQGGTDALLACAWEPDVFKSLVTWAGAPDMMLDGFFSEEDYEEAKQNGFFVMEFDWRDSLNVSLDWCEDVAGTDVLDEFAKGYDGPVLAIAGTDDDTVDPEWSEKIAAASANEQSGTYFIEGMDHTFNVFAEEDLHSLYNAVDATGQFFAATLSHAEEASVPAEEPGGEALPLEGEGPTEEQMAAWWAMMNNIEIPGDYEIEETTISIPSLGLALEAILTVPQADQETYPMVILTHGFNTDFQDTAHLGEALGKNGIASIRINLPGSGNSEGLYEDCDFDAQRDHILNALAYAKTLDITDTDNLFLCGKSQGGFDSGLAALACEDEINALCLWFPAFCIPDDFREGHVQFVEFDLNNIPDKVEIRPGFAVGRTMIEQALDMDIFEVFPAFQKDVLIIQGDEDPIVAMHYAEDMAQAYPSCNLMIIPGGGHGFFGDMELEALSATVDFIKTHLK